MKGEKVHLPWVVKSRWLFSSLSLSCARSSPHQVRMPPTRSSPNCFVHNNLGFPAAAKQKHDVISTTATKRFSWWLIVLFCVSERVTISVWVGIKSLDANAARWSFNCQSACTYKGARGEKKRRRCCWFRDQQTSACATALMSCTHRLATFLSHRAAIIASSEIKTASLTAFEKSILLPVCSKGTQQYRRSD